MKAEIKKGTKGFYFRLIGRNGEQIASSGTERYHNKADVRSLLEKYFPDFEIVDKTKE